MKTFRFDDVCINADIRHICKLTDRLFEAFPGCKIIHAISPLVQFTGDERVFPKIQNAVSDYRAFYKVDLCGTTIKYIGSPPDRIVKTASHGLIHVDHRLLKRSAQEMSILVSCSLIGSAIFVPPFNKWNRHTEKICKENEIELIKFEDGWRCMEYEPYNDSQDLWYLHAREITMDKLNNWIDGR